MTATATPAPLTTTTMIATLPNTAPSVDAVINFNDPSFNDSVVDDIDRANSRTRFVAHSVPITDLRGHEQALGLESNAFAVVRSRSACTDFSDEDEVLACYYPEAAELVKRLTGARCVVPYGHLVRSKRPGAPSHARTPALNAHIDNDFATSRQVAERLAPAEFRDGVALGRFMVINVWRPLSAVERNPLAIVDGSTVQRGNLHPVRLLASRAGVSNPCGYNLSYSAEQRWYYLSNMQPDEVLAFKQIDSKPDAVQWAAHTSFDDPTSAPDAQERESIEIRAVAFLPW